MDEKTKTMSGGFNRLPEFTQIVAHTELSVPYLLNDPENLPWWRLEAVWTIAAEAGKPIEFPEEARGKHAEVSAIVLDWARQNGLLPEDQTV